MEDNVKCMAVYTPDLNVLLQYSYKVGEQEIVRLQNTKALVSISVTHSVLVTKPTTTYYLDPCHVIDVSIRFRRFSDISFPFLDNRNISHIEMNLDPTADHVGRGLWG